MFEHIMGSPERAWIVILIATILGIILLICIVSYFQSRIIEREVRKIEKEGDDMIAEDFLWRLCRSIFRNDAMPVNSKSAQEAFCDGPVLYMYQWSENGASSRNVCLFAIQIDLKAQTMHCLRGKNIMATMWDGAKPLNELMIFLGKLDPDITYCWRRQGQTGRRAFVRPALGHLAT